MVTGYPHYPAMIVDPDPGHHYRHNNRSIPAPSERVLSGRPKPEDDNHYLVLFFDDKRTWAWLTRDKLERFGVDSELDSGMLDPKFKTHKRHKTKLQVAYNEAIKHRDMVSSPPRYNNLSVITGFCILIFPLTS
jgi:bromodomain and PHD finger-containing protein 3